MADFPIPQYQPDWAPSNPWPIPHVTFTPYMQLMPPRFTVPGKRVAVEPFQPAAKAEVRGGVIVPMNQSNTTGLRVIFGSTTLGEGWLIYVRTKLRDTTQYAKEIFEVDGRRFILIPEEEVLVVDATLAAPAVP